MRKWALLVLLLTFGFVTVGALFLGSTTVSAQEQKYVGAEKCKGCHPQQFTDFESRKFTKAWSVLQMRGKTKDPECLKCHVTGYGQPGGFISEEATPQLKYKQCEVCHGAGNVHINNPGDATARAAMKDYVSKRNVCIDCHKCMKTHKEADF
jgi:nitrate/TMAO reductase-like tetraheme cytochrome c subunit